MTEEELLRCQLHARLPGFRRKVEMAERIIWQAFDECGIWWRSWYVAFSGGIDSTVLLDLARREWHGARIDVLWGDDGWDYPETLAFLEQVDRERHLHLTRVRSLDPWRDWCVEMERPDLAEVPDTVERGVPVWSNPRGWEYQWRSLTKDAPGAGYGGVFLGMLGTERKAGGESRVRAMQLHGGARPLYQVAREGGMWHCSPLASWTKQDVWAYVALRNLPYNAAYDKLAAQGIPLERRRVAPLTCFRTTQYGSVVSLRFGWPDLYNRLAAVFPAVRRYG